MLICLKRMSVVLILIFVFQTHSICTGQNKDMADYKEQELEKKVTEVLAKMNLEEKLGQLTLYTCDYGPTGPTLREEYIQGIKSGKIGAIFNAFTVDFTGRLQKIAIEETRLKIPLLYGYDVIHGFCTVFPIPLGEAASWDITAIEMSARIAATEAASAGVHWTFAPMVDIARDPRWGRIAEGSGEDPYLGSIIARARVKGFQGDDLASDDTILACAKHFAAYGAAEGGRDYNTVDISERTLRETYLRPFHAALEAGVSTFMTSFNEIGGVPSTGNKHLLTDILRGEWHFKGFVVTDYTSITEMIQHGIVSTPAEAALLAIQSGVDMDMQSGSFQNELAGLVKQGLLQESLIDEAVKRVLRMKFMLGLFDDPYRYCNIEHEKQRIMTPSHMAAAFDMAKKSIVLLKNNPGILPLGKDIKTLAVIGPLAESRRELLGSWCAVGDSNRAVSLLQGIKNKVSSDTKVLYAKGCDINDSSTEGFAEAVKAASEVDVVIVAVGEEALMSGEAASRASLALPGVQEELLKELHKTGKPIVMVLMNGRPLTINWANQNIPAILECWFLGTQAGSAISEVIFGDYNPSGKLPVTFPRSVGQVQIYYNHKNTGRPISGDKYTSKYLDIENTPLYPFGFGLSYTTFAYSDLEIEKPSIKRGENIKVSVSLKNTGAREGTETVQLYIRDEFASVTRPVMELRGFQKVTLKPDESKRVEFTLTPKDLSFYDINMNFTLEPGTFKVMIGTNSSEVLSATFKVEE